jgi:uncharacterized protein
MMGGFEPTAVWASLDGVEVAYAVVVVLLGYTVLGLTGFGSALVMVPLLALHWPLATVVPLVLLTDVPASLWHGGLNLRRIAWREVRALVPAMLLGVLLGVWLTAWSRQAWPLLVLGIYIVAVGVRGLRPAVLQGVTRPAHPAVGGFAGLMVGLVSSLFGTAGPVVIAWLARRLPDPLDLRATVPMVIVVVASAALLGMGFGGQLDQPLIWAAWPPLLVLAVAGVTLGHRLAQRLPAPRVRGFIFGLLVLSGLAMVVRALRHWA